jgi:hypothetical protein
MKLVKLLVVVALISVTLSENRKRKDIVNKPEDKQDKLDSKDKPDKPVEIKSEQIKPAPDAKIEEKKPNKIAEGAQKLWDGAKNAVNSGIEKVKSWGKKDEPEKEKPQSKPEEKVNTEAPKNEDEEKKNKKSFFGKVSGFFSGKKSDEKSDSKPVAENKPETKSALNDAERPVTDPKPEEKQRPAAEQKPAVEQKPASEVKPEKSSEEIAARNEDKTKSPPTEEKKPEKSFFGKAADKISEGYNKVKTGINDGLKNLKANKDKKDEAKDSKPEVTKSEEAPVNEKPVKSVERKRKN